MRAKFIVSLMTFLLLPTSQPFGQERHETDIQTASDGTTIEQRLIERRLKEMNADGKVLFLYVGSAYTGDLIYQSVVESKVISSGKRLSPGHVYTWKDSDGHWHGGSPVDIADEVYYTEELLSDDGTYGHSHSYLFWFDVDGTYFQQFVTDGVFIVTANRPVDFKLLKAKMAEELNIGK